MPINLEKSCELVSEILKTHMFVYITKHLVGNFLSSEQNELI